MLITGGPSLIGSALAQKLKRLGVECMLCDIAGKGADGGDICDRVSLEARVQRCGGIVHLAAVSPAIWAEAVPD